VTVEVVVFDADDLAPVLAAIDPRGWVNLQPEVDPDVPIPSAPGVFAVFSARGPVVPLGTWHPGERSVGLQHSTGTKAASRVEVPPGWRVVQDHPKRGLVLRVPAGVTDADALAWLIRTGTALCPVPILGRWVAEVHR
jgi:hypothetical protein